jgi:hypothetical protein
LPPSSTLSIRVRIARNVPSTSRRTSPPRCWTWAAAPALHEPVAHSGLHVAAPTRAARTSGVRWLMRSPKSGNNPRPCYGKTAGAFVNLIRACPLQRTNTEFVSRSSVHRRPS